MRRKFVCLAVLTASFVELSIAFQSLGKFDPKKQYIPNTGKYRFIPPGPTDKRGPCPGLNVLANHGYMDRSGIDTIEVIANASNFVFGFDRTFSRSVSGLGLLLTGDPYTRKWSIGGAPPGPPSPNMKRNPTGLSGSHHLYETDASTFKTDAYISNGDSDSSRKDLLEEFLWQLDPSNADYRDQRLWDYARLSNRLAMQKKNPKFLFTPLASQIVSPAGSILSPNLFSNHSKEHPDGTMSREVFLAFFGAEDRSKGLVVRKGWERIPDNWYRRYEDFSGQEFVTRIANQTRKYKDLARLGGAMGRENTFKEVTISELTFGALKDEDYYGNANGIACGAGASLGAQYERIKDYFYKKSEEPDSILNDWVGPGFGWAVCPQIKTFRSELLDLFPGARLYGPWA